MNTLPTVALQNPKQKKVVRLSEMLSNFSLVKLETSKDILIGEGTKYLVSDKFIITAGPDKILLFSNKGKYIRTIAVTGKGPNEYANIVACTIDDKNGILYINQRDDPGIILAYNLNKNEPVRKIPTGKGNLLYYIVVLSNNVLAISPGNNMEYNILFLSTSGKILSEVSPSKGIGIGISISKVSDEVYYKPKQIDTLYIINNYKKVPYCYIKVESRATLTNNEKGNFVFLPSIGSNFMIAKKLHATNIEYNSDYEALRYQIDKSTLYWIEKNDFTASEITGFYNDYFGIEETFNPYNNYLSVCNDFGFIRYSSFELKKWLNKTLESPDLDNSVKLKISKFNDDLNENDNPVLIFGKLK
jgi:hypothetical protein